MFKIFRKKPNQNKPIMKTGGWLPDPANKKYWRFDRSSLSLNLSNTLQYKSSNGDVDLRPYTSARHDQSATSSCVGNAAAKALEIKRIIQHGHSNHADLSRLAVYYNARARMTPSMVDWDNGTYISLACDVIRDIGVCREQMHPFSTGNVYNKPSLMAERESRLNRINSHFKIKSYGQDRLDDMIFNLQAGNPIIFGTTVGKDWQRYRGGNEPLRVETQPSGGHAMCAVGFVNGLIIIENSWGTFWGEDGFGYADPAVFTHPSTRDIWVMVDGSEAWTEKK